ncbi:terminase large subunit [Enterobacter kobei]|uniref:terminase large subunit n=1 Tax=Enterobacter kobei TaxID=208224 RepID=UPI002F2C1BF3
MTVLQIMNLYCEQVLSGEIVAGQLIKKACKRHLWDLSRVGSETFKYQFSEARAKHIIEFMKVLRDPSYPDQPITLMPWHYFILGSIFGWVSTEKSSKTGRYNRRYRTAEVFVGRKNGKSFLASGIALYMLAFDGERQAEVYSAATKRDQAKIVFDATAEFVRSSNMSSMIKHTRNLLAFKATGSKMEPLSSDARTLDGLKPHCAITDEIHAMDSREVYDVLETATGAREQPLMFIISTAGFILDGIATELWGYGEYILDCINTNHYNEQHDRFFAALYCIDDKDDIFDESVWIKANPTLGVIKKIEDMQAQAEKAKTITSAQGNFKTKHLNRFCNSTDTWLTEEHVSQCFDSELKPIELKGRECWIGLDLASKKDMTAISGVFPQIDGSVKIISRSFLPEEAFNKASVRIQQLYTKFIQRGELFLTPGETVDYEFVREELLNWKELFDIKAVAFDPFNASMFCQRLENHDGFPMVEVKQSTASLNEPSKQFEKMIIDGDIKFDTSLFRWCCLNAQVKIYPDGNIKVQKENLSSENKVDCVVAAITAMAIAVIPDHEFNPYDAFDGIDMVTY